MKLRRNQYLIHDMFDDGAALCGLVSMAEHAHNPQCPLDWKREPAFASIWWVVEAEEIVDSYWDGRGWWTKPAFASAWKRRSDD